MYVSPNHPDYERLKARSNATAEAPAPTGETLATFPRKGPDGVEQELRVVLDDYQGHRYIAIRLWQAGQGGAFWPLKGKGISVQLSEAEGVAAALAEALGRAEREAAPEQRTEQPAREASPRRRRRPEGRRQWDQDGSPPAPSRGFDDAY